MIKNLQSAIINQQPTIDSQKSMINSQESTIRNNVEDVDAILDEPLEDVSVTGDVLALAFFSILRLGRPATEKVQKEQKESSTSRRLEVNDLSLQYSRQKGKEGL